MNRFTLSYILCIMSAAYPALGSPTISVNTQYMLNTNAARQIPILVSSSPAEQILGVDLAVQIGDGGPVNSGVNTAPRITNLDIIGPGTVFNTSNTGSTPYYLSANGNPPYLIAQAGTTTDAIGSTPTVNANGVLAYLTVNPSGAVVGSYQIHLDNVGANVPNIPPLVWDTTLYGADANFGSNNFYIQIVNLHQSIWNAGASGLWTNATWTSTAPPVPNYTTQAIVNTPYTVNVTSAQEADSLAISATSGIGQVAISSAGSLAITQGVTVSTNGVLSIAAGSGLTATGIQLNGGTIAGTGTINPAVTTTGGGTLNAPNVSDILVLSSALDGAGGLTKIGSGTAKLLNDAVYEGATAINAGCLQFNGPDSSLHHITGLGTLGIGDGVTPSIVMAEKVNVGTLNIAAGSKLVITPMAGRPLSRGDSIKQVPEPSAVALLIAAALGIFYYYKRIR